MAKSDPNKNAVNTVKSVHLSASAGSGKTRALKERYLTLLNELDERGLGLDQAVAITFTDKAAAEIKERVIRDLREGMLKKIIRGGSELRISTIHSFCMNLLKRYPLEAGLLPDFGVLDSRDQTYKIQKSIEQALEQADHDHEIAPILRRHSIDELMSRTEFLLSIRSRLKRLEIDAGGAENLIASMMQGMELAAAERTMNDLLAGDEWRDTFAGMGKILQLQGDAYEDHRGEAHTQLIVENDAASVLKALEILSPIYFTQADTPRKNTKLSSKAFKAKKDHEQYQALFYKIQELISRFKHAAALLHSGNEAIALLKLYLHAENEYQESKLREGLLDFDDLEIFAYRLLQGLESPDILYWLDRKILHVLVDEFQDTSDIQWAIVRKLTEELFAGLGADKPMPPTLFVVGDDKQSIYRFREANYRLIHDVKEQMQTNMPSEAREILTLDRNFRSAPAIIDTVNAVFGKLWGDSYVPSQAVRKDTGTVRLIELGTDEEERNRPNQTEAEVLALTIRTMIDNGVSIYDHHSALQARPAGFGDCAILIQSRTKLKDYEAALRSQNIPYRVIGGIGFYEELEIQALINVLFFIRNRADNLALAVALTSPLFGISDDDIFTLMHEGKNLAEALQQHRPDLWRTFERWAGLARFASLPVLIHRIVEDTGAYVRFGKQNPQAVFNIDKLLDTAREFDRRGYTTLQDFVEWVKNIRSTEQREATSDMNLPGFEGSVSIMTVHKAKGLEYGIVFLPGMNQAARSLSIGPEALVRETREGRCIAVRNEDSPLYEQLWEEEREELRLEHQRLLYVAMTRARDHLVLLGSFGKAQAPKPNTWLHFLRQGLPLQQCEDERPEKMLTYSYPDWGPKPENFEPPKSAAATVGVETAINPDSVLQNIMPLPLSGSMEWKRASDLNKTEKENAFLASHHDDMAGLLLARGSILHRCLEEFTINGTYDIEQIMATSSELGGLEQSQWEDFAENIKATLTSVLSQEEFAWIFKAGPGSYSELPFLYRRDHALITGMIDRLVIHDDIGYVIDYKGIRIESEEALEAWINLYRPQIQVYSEAAKELFKLKNVEGYLLFLDSNRLQLVCKT